MQHGFTLEKIQPRAAEAAAGLGNPLVRIVKQRATDARRYRAYIIELMKVSQVQILPVDSFFVTKEQSVEDYVDIFKECADAFGDLDIRWEYVNEVGGGSPDPMHLHKAIAAFDWMRKHLPTRRRVLNGYAAFDYVQFLSTIPLEIRRETPEVGVSCYPQDGCVEPEKIDWTALAMLFPNSKLRILECGQMQWAHRCLERFWNLKPSHPSVDMTMHWWYGSQQLVPKPKSRKMPHLWVKYRHLLGLP